MYRCVQLGYPSYTSRCMIRRRIIIIFSVKCYCGHICIGNPGSRELKYPENNQSTMHFV